LIPRLGELFKAWEQGKLEKRLEAIGLPYAPIAKPWDLLDDPHLKASGGLLETHYSGKRSHIPALPIELDGKRLVKRSDPPVVGEHGATLLSELGYSQSEIAGLAERRIVAFPTNGGGDQ
jgi:crotonobetainyl-CoA:carnitine CoA-transferase CaiB-like acyl-CoA transferase